MTEISDNVVGDGIQIEDVDTLRRHYGDERAALMNQLFNLPAEAAGVDVTMSATEKQALGETGVSKARAAMQEAFSREKIDAAKVRWIESELEEAAAVQALAEHASEVISPKEASPEAILQAASMAPDQIVAASEVARSMGDAAEDTLLVLLQACIQRDLDQEAWHIAEMNEDWKQALTVIGEASQLPDEPDPDEFAARFDVQVPQSSYQLLSGGEDTLNKLGRIR